MNKIKTPLVSIVMPCYNSKDMVLGAVKSVLETHYPNLELIIVDDVSTDGTFELLNNRISRNLKVRIIQNERNFGPSYTRNHGIKEAKGKYVAFIETDMEVHFDWLLPLVKALEADSRLGGVQSRVLDMRKRSTIQTLGVLYDPHTFWVYPPGCGLSKDWLPENLEMGIGSVGSVIRKSVIDKIGGYDEKLVHNIDDIELGWRIWLCGYKTKTIPESVTYHWTMKPENLRSKITPTLKSEFHLHKTPRIFLKDYELLSIVRYIPWLYFAYLVRILINLFRGNSTPLKAFVKSLLWGLATFPDTLKERKRIQHLRKRSDKEMFSKLGLKGNFLKIYVNKIHFNLLRGKEAFGQ